MISFYKGWNHDNNIRHTVNKKLVPYAVIILYWYQPKY